MLTQVVCRCCTQVVTQMNSGHTGDGSNKPDFVESNISCTNDFFQTNIASPAIKSSPKVVEILQSSRLKSIINVRFEGTWQYSGTFKVHNKYHITLQSFIHRRIALVLLKSTMKPVSFKTSECGLLNPNFLSTLAV